MASDPLMQNGEAIARNGEALASASVPAPCCCGGGTGCTFTHQPPPCTICAGTGGNCRSVTGTANRQVFRVVNGGPAIYLVNESWPVSYCCADTAGMPYSGRGFLQEEDVFCPNLHCRVDVAANGPADASGRVLISATGSTNRGQPACALVGNPPVSTWGLTNCSTGLLNGLVYIPDVPDHYSNCSNNTIGLEYTFINYTIYYTFIPGSFREYLFIGEVDSGPPPVYRTPFRVIKHTIESWGPVRNCTHVEPNCPPRGACCCGGQCYPELTASECASGGGQWRGAGTTCEQECIGGCCTPLNGCVNMSFNACKAMGGAWLGGACTGLGDCDRIGACCDNTTGECSLTAESLCVAPRVFHGVGSGCFPSPCPPPSGACCNGGNCTIKTQANCSATGGTWLGANTNCNDPNTCSQPGACCLPGGCQDVPSASACTLLGGVFAGPGTFCSTTSCGTGACCVPIHGGASFFCSQETLETCQAQAGTWHGIGSQCGPNNEICAPPPGSIGSGGFL